MKNKMSLLFMLVFLALDTFSQHNPCGIDSLIKFLKVQNPSLDSVIRKYENQFEEKVKEGERGKHINSENDYPKNSIKKWNGSQSIMSLCGYDNTYIGSGAAPTAIGGTITVSNMYGGDYLRVTGMVAGKTYRISTCGNNDFDTQISIYTAGGGTAVAHNDDFCLNGQSEIYFTPLATGNYDILLDEYNCGSTFFVSTTLVVELDYIPAPVITIPVVVHVVYNSSIENISNSQIISQINVLNKDFRRLNSDIPNAPAAFRGWSSDARYQFCLAQQDPNGLPSTGITRTYTSNTLFNLPSDTSIWFTSLGGKDGWNRLKYLNIWVCDLPGGGSTPGIVGIGFWPWLGAVYPKFDGVVADYEAFGTIGTATYPLNLGRNVTHEVGHYLGLSHVWGDEASNGCVGSDSVADTPNQYAYSTNIPSFPLVDACTPNYPGVMFNNYMDYSNDVVRHMFTYFQTARMDAAIRNGGLRANLATSNGCSPSSVGYDELIFENNITVFPNPNNGNFSIIQNGNTRVLNVLITNILGEIVIEKSTSDLKTEIDLSNQSNGIYFVQINSIEKSFIKKIIINK